jgi:hypothetical protein
VPCALERERADEARRGRGRAPREPHECAWEVFENTDAVIQRYRAATVSLGYYGDSVLNSVGDVLAALLGCAFAARLPARWLVLGVVLLEGILAVWIRDNLTLNVLMLLRPIDAIRRWQLGG